MEEILASIRRIIADDQEVPNGASSPDSRSHASAQSSSHDDDDILDLAEIARPNPMPRPALVPEPPAAISEPEIHDDPVELAPVFTPPEREPELAPVIAFRPALSEPAPEPEPEPEMPAAEVEAREPVRPSLSFSELAEPIEALVSTEATASVGHAFSMLSHTILTQNARTLEDLVKDMLKPMLKAWLDDNLPPLVERLVRTEIERVARGGR
jgi:cell pole-organizing protein PopZ